MLQLELCIATSGYGEDHRYTALAFCRMRPALEHTNAPRSHGSIKQLPVIRRAGTSRGEPRTQIARVAVLARCRRSGERRVRPFERAGRVGVVRGGEPRGARPHCESDGEPHNLPPRSAPVQRGPSMPARGKKGEGGRGRSLAAELPGGAPLASTAALRPAPRLKRSTRKIDVLRPR